MQRQMLVLALCLAAATLVFADGGGMGAGGMMGGSGMTVVAHDGSVLVTQMGMTGMMGGGNHRFDRELVNIDSDGNDRWRISFDDGWPMMPVNDGDLIILPLADDWWMGGGGSGDGGWNHGGGHGGGGGGGGGSGGSRSGMLVALSLANGEELWRLEFDGDMVSMPQFSPDGSRFYTTVRDMSGDPAGGGPMHQGDAAGSGFIMSHTLVAVDRNGNILWSRDLSNDGMGGGMR